MQIFQMSYNSRKPQEYIRESFEALKTSFETYTEEHSSEFLCIQVCEQNSEGKEWFSNILFILPPSSSGEKSSHQYSRSPPTSFKHLRRRNQANKQSNSDFLLLGFIVFIFLNFNSCITCCFISNFLEWKT